MSASIDKELQDWLAGAKRVVVAGVGNPMRDDDYVGLKIAENLIGRVPDNVHVFDCEAVPEVYLFDIEEFHPTHVLVVDAAILGHKPGEASFVRFDDVQSFSALSSHALPLRLFCEYIEKSTGATIRLLLIEPLSTELGECLSPVVSATAEKLSKTLFSLLSGLSSA
jgi:hydrogenase 3 maturation protease